MTSRAVPILLLIAAAMPGAELISGLGGPAGFGERMQVRNDDSFEKVDLTSVFPTGLRYYGTVYTEMWVNNNGNFTFANGSSTFTPGYITANQANPIIAAWYADVDTREESGAGGQTWSGAQRTNALYYDFDTVNHVFTATWDYVGYYYYHVDKRCAFQIRLIRVGNGQEFDIEFRYKQLQWVTGDASGGTDGFGGTVVRAGFSAGNGRNYFELPQSGDQSAMLALTTTPGNTGDNGRWLWEVRKPQVYITPGSGYTNRTSIPVTFSVTTDATGFDASDIAISGGVAGTLSNPVVQGNRNVWNMTVALPTEGTMRLSVPGGVVTSTFGDTNDANELVLIVDRTPPAAPTLAVGTGERPLVSGMTEAGATVSVLADGRLAAKVVADGTGAWSWQSGGLSGGSHAMTATATDLADNTGPASAAATMTFTPASSGSDSGGCGGGLGGLILAACAALGLRRRRV